ncbi:MAG: hypothetical protein ACOCU6_03385, partial [Nanoarchaeota archaeon]
FVGEIKANISTEVQMRTRDEGDLERLKTKYGEELLQAVVKTTAGTGMIENPSYNKGRPYLISFRPIKHSIERLSDKDLEQYNKYNKILDDLDYQVKQLQEMEQDVFDLKLELKLAYQKLKAGQFNMVDIYLESLIPSFEDTWKKLGKEPKKRPKRRADINEVKKSIEKAKKERQKVTKESEEKKDDDSGEKKKPDDDKDSAHEKSNGSFDDDSDKKTKDDVKHPTKESKGTNDKNSDDNNTTDNSGDEKEPEDDNGSDDKSEDDPMRKIESTEKKYEDKDDAKSEDDESSEEKTP